MDWIGVDGYDRTGPRPSPGVLGFYPRWVAQGKPMMVAETGRRGRPVGIYRKHRHWDAPFPAFKAVVYSTPRARRDWQFSGDGLVALAALARDPYFPPG